MEVSICVPSTGAWKPRMGRDLAHLCCKSLIHGISVDVICEDNAGVSEARNKLVEAALQRNADYILFIDSDMGFPDDSLYRLIQHDKDIVGATARKRRPPYELLGIWKEEEIDGLHEALMLGTGFLLIKSSVFSKIERPWFYESYNENVRTSEDVNFIEDARLSAGLKVYVDLNLSKEIIHIGDIDVAY